MDRHCRQRRSSVASNRLSATYASARTQVLHDLIHEVRERRSDILCLNPPRRRPELSICRIERDQITDVPTSRMVVRSSVELEANEIGATDDTDMKSGVPSPFDPPRQSAREPLLPLESRPRVEPVVGETHIPAHGANGRGELLGKGHSRRLETPCAPRAATEREDIHVAGRAPDDAEQVQSGATDDDDGMALTGGVEQLTHALEGCFDIGRSRKVAWHICY